MTRLDEGVTTLWRRFDAALGALDCSGDWPREHLLRRDRPLMPAGQRTSPNGYCHLLRAADGWIALNVAREDDRAALPAWLELDQVDITPDAIEAVTTARPSAELRERARLVGIPVGVVGETAPEMPVLDSRQTALRTRQITKLRVLDLSALWAGPLCGALLAGAGADVLRVEDPRRPDPTALTTPELWARTHHRKRFLRQSVSAASLANLLGDCDVLITSARPAALARLGLAPDIVAARYPHLLWIAITAYGWQPPSADRVGFGDDTAASGGLIEWREGEPVFLGDALADPLTGLASAATALEAIAEGRAGMLDCGMGPIAASI